MVVSMVFPLFLTHWWIEKDTMLFRFSGYPIPSSATLRCNIIKDILDNRSQYAAFLTILLTILVLTVASVLVLQFESKSPDANITSGGDALWYSLVTITTVGYGDFYPVTAAGRIIVKFHHVHGRRHHRRPGQYSRQHVGWVIGLP